MNKHYTKKEILESKQILKEDWIENTLMVAGFVPFIGEIADVILIIRYIVKKEYLYAGLMLIALIPTVGDIIAKPFIRLLKGAGAAGRVALRSGDDMAKFLMENPAAKEQFLKMAKHFDNPGVVKTIGGVSKINSSWGEKMMGGVNTLKTVAGKLKPVRMAQRVGQEIATQGPAGFLKTMAGRGPVAMGIKNFFREERLAQYIAKKGSKPSTWVSNWWNVVRGGRRDRRNMVKALIISSGILNMLGLPSFESFESELEKNPELANRLANDPNFSAVVNNSGVTDAELAQINGQQSGGAGVMGGVMGLGVLKMMAKMLV